MNRSEIPPIMEVSTQDEMVSPEVSAKAKKNFLINFNKDASVDNSQSLRLTPKSLSSSKMFSHFSVYDDSEVDE